jgi:hypothetical protein
MTWPLTETDRDNLKQEILQLNDDLGRVAATPPINPVAAAKRESYIRVTCGEIARLQRLLAIQGRSD